MGGGSFSQSYSGCVTSSLGEMIIWTLYKLERNEQSLICIFSFNGENITHKSKNTSYKSSNDLQAVIGSITDTPDVHPAAGESTSVHRMMVFPPPSLSTTMDLTKDWSKDVRVVDLVGKVTTVGAVIQKQKKCKWTINHSRLELLGTSGLMGCGWSSERSSLKELDALEASGTRVPRNSTDNT